MTPNALHDKLILKFNCLPFKTADKQLWVHCSEQSEVDTKTLALLSGYEHIHCEPLPFDAFNRLWLDYFPQSTSGTAQEVKPIQFKKDEDYISRLIEVAQEAGSSDIHIECFEHEGRIRMRRNGKLKVYYTLALEQYGAMLNKIKLKAQLDIAEKRLPQDGRISYRYKNHEFDLRVSSLPTLHGEKIVMRLLVKDQTLLQLEALGMDGAQLQAYQEGIKNQNGIILISGPTGSGKTTTLYATLKALNTVDTNILTIEDPIEYTLEGINQMQLKEDIGLDFSTALRSFLRQDPDVIMVGEIRDEATAQMAVRAALTGHLVLSTIHTNSAKATVSRLLDMGIAPYLLAGTLRLSLAQRLVALLCPHCKQNVAITKDMYPSSFEPYYLVEKAYESQGCQHCQYTGIAKRKALYELLSIDDALAQRIKQKERIEDDYTSIKEKAFDLFAQGQTSLMHIYPLLLSTE